MVKKYIASKIPHGTLVEVVNLDEQPERRKEAIELSDGALTVPVTVVEKRELLPNGKPGPRFINVAVGWNPSKLAEILR